MKRGLFFSTDALIALVIILVVLLVAIPFVEIPKPRTELHRDIIETFSSLKIGEVDNAYARSLISQGKITNLNNSVLEQLGELYLTDLSSAQTLASELLSDVETNKNFELVYGTKTLYSSGGSIENAKNIETARQIVSGIEEGKNVTGFSARAFLASALQNKYYYFGGYIGDGNITARIIYSGNITSAVMELAINNDFEVYVNGNYAGSYNKSVSEFTPSTYTLPTASFNSGTNLVELKGNYPAVSGGFIKITYKATPIVESQRYYFPGISGLINIYDGFYIPNTLTSLALSLHLDTAYKAFLNIGNVTIFNGLTNGEQTITLDNSQLSTLLDYNSISKKTIPLRLGLENVSFVSNATNVDVFSVTDISGSMGGQKIADAKIATSQLIDTILNYSENKVGLVGYDTWAKSSNFHQISNDSSSLKNEVNSWTTGGYTCICCGILRATSCFNNNIFKDDFNGQTINSNPIGWEISEGNGAINITPGLEGDRAVSISRLSSQNPIMRHRFAPQEDKLSIEFLINHTSGSGRAMIAIESATSGYSSASFENYIIIKLYSGYIRNNDAQITPYSLNTIYKIKIEISPDSNNYDLFVNDILVGDNLAVVKTKNNIARIRFTTESANIKYILDDIKVFLTNSICDPSSNDKEMIVMTDGQANRACGLSPVQDHDTDGSTNDDAQDQAIQAACDAFNIHGIKVHAVGFGTGADETTLQKIAQCGNGSYYFADVGELTQLYQQIAEDIISSAYQEQTLKLLSGNVLTTLFPDSYLEFQYTPIQTPYGLLITNEKPFDNEISGTFALPSSSSLVEARAISYSGPRWTDIVKINNDNIYQISDYGQSYTSLGDPYSISIPISLVQSSNVVEVTTGLSPANSSSGSASNKIIYTLLENISAYSDIAPTIQGCLWQIEFEDSTNITLTIPSNYTGSDTCFYTSSQQSSLAEISTDAAKSSVLDLLQRLDSNSNNKVDTKFTEQDLQIETTEVVGIPYTWSTEVKVLVWD